jgi:tellurite resistance protein TerC
MFSKLKYGLAFILSFIGLKMLIAPFYHVEASISLLIVLGALILAVLASLIWKEQTTEVQ